MFSLNLANVAIGSALAIVPFSFTEQGYDNVQKTVIHPSKQETMNAELRETVIVAETLLAAFHTIASNDLSVFEKLAKSDIVALFQQAEQLSQILYSHFLDPNDRKLLQRYTQTLEKAHQLYLAVEYRKDADQILLSRKDSAVGMTFDESSTEEDIRKVIFGA